LTTFKGTRAGQAEIAHKASDMSWTILKVSCRSGLSKTLALFNLSDQKSQELCETQSIAAKPSQAIRHVASGSFCQEDLMAKQPNPTSQDIGAARAENPNPR
jgi:hypothetical protein